MTDILTATERYAHLTAQIKLLEEEKDALKEAALKEVLSAKDFEGTNPFVDTAYGKLSLLTKTKYVFDPKTVGQVVKLKGKIKEVEETAIAEGKAEMVISNFLTLRA